MQEIRVYNTLRRSIEVFRPIDEGCVRVYSCGPTVYTRQHLGNLRTYVFADLLRRVLEYFGYRVRHVINVTDVGHLTDDADHGEDKLERAARHGGSSARELAARVFASFERDLLRLNVLSPSVWCKASEHISQQIELVLKLEAKGFTYRLPDGIYFDTARDENYGKLSALCATREHTRLHASSGKRSPADFALWKLSNLDGPKREMEWPSPWGIGFPGWHIECSAMASHYLGEQFDIHTGGMDHIAVHHTNEIAQAEHGFGVKPWVGYWLHGAWLLSSGEKLSKSAGGAPSLDDLEDWQVTPAAFRYYLLTAHYRAPLSLSLEALKAAQTAWTRLSRFVTDGADESHRGEPLDAELLRAFDDALASDLDAPRALSIVWQAVHCARLSPAARRAIVRHFARTLGLELCADPPPASFRDEEREEIERLLEARERARRQRDFEAADRARGELAARGVDVVDTPDGPRWTRR